MSSSFDRYHLVIQPSGHHIVPSTKQALEPRFKCQLKIPHAGWQPVLLLWLLLWFELAVLRLPAEELQNPVRTVASVAKSVPDAEGETPVVGTDTHTNDSVPPADITETITPKAAVSARQTSKKKLRIRATANQNEATTVNEEVKTGEPDNKDQQEASLTQETVAPPAIAKPADADGNPIETKQLETEGAEGSSESVQVTGRNETTSDTNITSAPPRNDGLKVGMFQQGCASFYADKFHGRQTASGEHFDMYQMTAAHKTLPFGTVVSVTNLLNDKSIEVRINDRGPFIAGRIIDVSKGAAEYLEMSRAGIVPAKVVILSLPSERKTMTQNQTKVLGKPIQSGSTIEGQIPDHRRFAIQIASYSQIKYANKHLERLEKAGIPIHLEKYGKYYRLIVVNLNKEQVKYYRTELASLGIHNVLVRQE